MNDYVVTMVCYLSLIILISSALLSEIIEYFIRLAEHKEQLKENRERVWKYFVGMGN